MPKKLLVTALSSRLVYPSRSLRWSGWPFAAAMYLLGVAGCAFMSFGLPYLTGSPGVWGSADDVWVTTHTAQYIANGGLGAVYSVSPWYSALPGFLLIYAPVAALGDHLNLLTGYPFALPKPSMWLVTGPFFFLTGATAVLGVDYVADTLGIPTARRRVVGVMVALLVVAPIPGFMGHPEDLVALALSCLSIAFLLRGRPVGAAFALSAAILSQTWAGLLIPVFIVSVPAGLRIRSLARIVVVPAAMAAMFLVFDFGDTLSSLLHQPMAAVGQRLPWWALAGHVTIHDDAGTFTNLANGSNTRCLAVLAACLAAWWIRHDPTPEKILLAAGIALFARGFFEAEIFAYYLAPAAVVIWLLAATTVGSRKRLTVALVSGLAIYGSAPMAMQGVASSPWLALAILASAGALAFAACRSVQAPGLDSPLMTARYPALVRDLAPQAG